MTILEDVTTHQPMPGTGLTALFGGAPVGRVTACRPPELAAVLAHLADGPDDHAAVVLDTTAEGDAVLAVADADDPLVYRTAVVAHGHGPLEGRRFTLDRAVPVHLPVGLHAEVLASAAGHPVAARVSLGGRQFVVIGAASLLDDAWLPVADNAELAALAIGLADRAGAVTRVRSVRPRCAGAPHPAPWVVDVTSPCDDLLALLPPADVGLDDPRFWRAVGRAGRALPPEVHDALVDFADQGHPSGALVVRGLPVGAVPATPASPRAATAKDHVSELVLLAAARRLGQPVGYAPEHGGELVQNLVPTAGAAGAQTSTSSAVMLEFHTEAAFHPHKPRFLLLLGLRADPFGEARTLLCSIDAVVDRLSLGARAVLAQPRFRTSADESYTGGRSGRLGRPVPVLSGDPARPTLTFDADLMTGTDDEAVAALEELRRLVHANHLGVALGAGDLLVVDNHAAVHGRSPFRARYDGTDRWLQRSFVVADLDPSAGERRGRVVTTRFVP